MSIADREVVVTREIDAPRELVFEAFTEKDHVVNWWVPSDTIIHEWNREPGGLWRYTQPGPNGTEYAFKIQFIEITKPTRFVYDFGPDAADAPEPVRTTVTFEEADGKTKVTLQLLFASAAERENAVQYGAAKGAKLALDNLAGYLAKQSQSPT
ncbi:MAG: SRPBCC domain-containing protein [Anaerolineales bacterium]|nr:SRPBCC domain-containing protein [Anaerolineales bacterium]